MCGIAGLIDPSLSAEMLARTAAAMADQLAHRGPDGSGTWVDADAAVALAHRRLSIIDRSPTGAQPMPSADERLVLTFNGEIYNYRELRREIENEGHRFRGSSDTEVLVECCARWGVQRAVERCAGMFAFAVWDRRSRQLWLVRDRLGIKPLYWTRSAGRLLFGSELKALLAHPAFRPEIDRAAVAAYLRYSFVPAPYSIYAGVEKLSPGTILVVSADGAARRIRYWSAAEAARNGLAEPLTLSLEDAADRVEAELRGAVRQHMLADVPLGAFLSGGIDSSTLVALMQQESATPVRSFSIGYRDAAYDEAAAARQIADHLGTRHETLVFEPEDAQAAIAGVPQCYDEPFADPSQLPTLVIAALTRRHVTAVVSGDGGDEVFAGYNRHRLAAEQRWLGNVPRIAGVLLGAVPPAAWDRLGMMLPAGRRPRQLGDKLHKLAGTLGASDGDDLYRRLMSHWDPPPMAAAGDEPDCLPESAGISDEIARMQALDMAFYLPDDILTKVDRATMSVGLEARVPYLDHRLVELCWRLPSALKLDGGVGKIVLRRILHRHVPPALVERPKMGFAVPLGAWLRGPLRDWAEALLAPERLRREGLVAVAPVRSAWEAHLSGRVNAAERVWSVLMLSAWHERWRSGAALRDT